MRLINGNWLPKSGVSPCGRRLPTLEELERQHITEVSEVRGWRVSGEKRAAKLLNVKPTTSESRIIKN